MIDLSQIQLAKIKLQKHQLNNEGCKCQMCQKLNRQQMMKIHIERVFDWQSQQYGEKTKQFYLKLITKMLDWEKSSRKIRFCLPEICVYQNLAPLHIFTKRNENSPIKCIRDKTKLHMFEIIQFFLQGFVYHNPDPIKKTQRKRVSISTGNYSQKLKNECIVLAKYRNNFYNMLTLTQIEGLFKSRFKYMRDGLMYLQTLVCTKDYSQSRINIKMRDLLKEQRYERAKNEIKIFYQEIKGSDLQYVEQQQEIQFENELKRQSIREYLQYLTMKIILCLSRMETSIISEAVFKYVYSKNIFYLIDVRVSKFEPNEQFWANAAMKAFEVRLSKRMSMMDIGSSMPIEVPKSLGKKAQQISKWLQKSTQIEWDQMKIIRNRLQRLQNEKKSLMQSQSMGEGSELSTNRSFKIRSVQSSLKK